MSLCFYYRKPTSVPVSTNQKKSEEDFHFYEKKAKSQNNFQCLFHSEPL